jgi:hypothetical protein
VVKVERRRPRTETPYFPLELTLEELKYSKNAEIRALATKLEEILNNEIHGLRVKIGKVETLNLKRDKNGLLGLVLLLWMLSPITFSSIPLIGLVNVAGAIWATIAYLKVSKIVS